MSKPYAPTAPWIRIHGLAEIEFLIKESEVLTGLPGRVFTIRSADVLAYRVHWRPGVLLVERLAASGEVIDSRLMPPQYFAQHSLAHALQAGQLYTVSVRTPH